MNISDLRSSRNEDNFRYFNQWVIDFFTREALRDTDRIETYRVDDLFGSAMRQEVSYWNPNRSKHAEVYWLENFVFRPEVSMVNRICNAMTVKFVGRPTTTLLACDTWDYAQVIDFEHYKIDPKYRAEINNNVDENRFDIKVWGTTQLHTSLQTSARNYCREVDNSQETFKLSHMIRWISYLDDKGMSDVVMNQNNRLRDVGNWLGEIRGIGPYYSYHPPCNFSRDDDLPNIDEDDDYCLVGPGAQRGLEYVFPDVKFKNNDIMEEYILAIRDHQYDFFEFKNDEFDFYKLNLERGGRLTTFGVEITLCQFDVFMNIRDNEESQRKRILPLTFDSYFDYADELREKMNQPNLEGFFKNENSVDMPDSSYS